MLAAFRRLFAVLLVLGTLLMGAGAADAANTIGVILLHGLQGGPNAMAGLSDSLTQAGYVVEYPELCWSRRRVYDETFPDCLEEVDAAIARLKALGITSFVVGGHSLGGNAAIYYGTIHEGLAGIIGLAPAGDAMRGSKDQDIAASMARATAMIAQGQGDQKADFAELNTGPRGQVAFTVTTTPRIYTSFHGPDSLATIPANVARLRAPLLWVAGTRDPTQRDQPQAGFDKAPANPLNHFVSVDATHLGTPEAARDAVTAWLHTLPAP